MSKMSNQFRAFKRAAKVSQLKIADRFRGLESVKGDPRFPGGEMGYHYISTSDKGDTADAYRHLQKSKSQYGQDLFVLAELGAKRGGYFVEFGATDGVRLSNTHLLEREFGWTGILAEPAQCWHKDLRKERQCVIDKRCVWSASGQTLQFTESASAMLSTISKFSDGDHMTHKRASAREYTVETISLADLLQEHNAPRQIDYMSVDTEGSEFDIMNSFDFSLYDIRVITCEHNFTDSRDRIQALLTSAGYVRKFENMSGMDDWYVKQS